jgi:hypothetical protein
MEDGWMNGTPPTLRRFSYNWLDQYSNFCAFAAKLLAEETSFWREALQASACPFLAIVLDASKCRAELGFQGRHGRPSVCIKGPAIYQHSKHLTVLDTIPHPTQSMIK